MTGDTVSYESVSGGKCYRLPRPWSCSLEHEHKGPCVATRDENVPERPLYVPCTTYSDHQMMFGLYKEQRDAIDRWIVEHDKARHIPVGQIRRYAGAIGGAYTYEFTSTTLGMCTTVRCSCGERIDVSNYDDW